MELLAQFLLRLAFGLAVGMAITSAKRVSSGFFRNHLYVTLGLTTLAAMACFAVNRESFWWALAAAVASYAGVVCWLYENSSKGKIALFFVAAFSLMSAVILYGDAMDSPNVDRYYTIKESETSSSDYSRVVDFPRSMFSSYLVLAPLSIVGSGLLLGLTFAAMLLGHWYLNSPGMELAPLRRLLAAAAGALVLQALVSTIGVAGEIYYTTSLSTQWMLFLALRWSFGIVGVGAMLWMAWQTLKIPNTQSATGILYVAVMGVFVGELTASLLSAESAFPL